MAGRKGIPRIQVKTRLIMIMDRVVKWVGVSAIKVDLCSVITDSNIDILYLNIRIPECQIIMDSSFQWSHTKGSLCMLKHLHQCSVIQQQS